MNAICKISIIIPALNEEDNIVQAIENVKKALREIDETGEIIVINDGSRDKTGTLVQEEIRKDSFIRMIHHKTSEGIGASVWHGIKESKGEIITWMPGDAENDAFETLRYLTLMDEVDIVIPFIYNQEVRTKFRRILSKVYKGIINLSFGMLLNYMNGTVMFRKSILQDFNLKNKGFFWQTELLIKSINKGYLYAEVPCALKHRIGGSTKAISLGSLLKVLTGYISTMVAVYFRPATGINYHIKSITYKRFKMQKNN
jgi:dolichol-phosphate mannosyltransferase